MKITVTTDAKGATMVAADETPKVLQVLTSRHGKGTS